MRDRDAKRSERNGADVEVLARALREELEASVNFRRLLERTQLPQQRQVWLLRTYRQQLAEAAGLLDVEYEPGRHTQEGARPACVHLRRRR